MLDTGSQPEDMFGSLHSQPRPPSPRLHFCRWGLTCTRSFSSGPELYQHFKEVHSPTLVPVKPDEIPMLLRITEGIGESYQTEHFLSSPSLSEKGEDALQIQISKDNSQKSNDSGPVASLPSPPVSSSSRPRGLDDDENSLSGSASPHSQARDPSPMFYEDTNQDDFASQSMDVLLSDALEPPSPNFVALDATTGSPRPGSIPPSPSFSDILASSTQKDTTKSQPPIIPDRPLKQTHSAKSSSSSNSCAIVEQQLTLADDDLSFDRDKDRPCANLAAAASASDHSDLYRGELNWSASQTLDTQQSIGLQPSSSSQASSSMARNHGNMLPRPSSHPHAVQNSSLHPSVSSRVPSFESPSSMRKQPWYAPTRARKKTRGNNLSASVSPVISPALSPNTLASPFSITKGPTNNHASPNPVQIDGNPLRSSFYRKRRRHNSSTTNDPAPPPIQTPLTTLLRSVHDDDADADVSQMQVETQVTMSPPVQQQRSSYDMYDYPLQTQAPYDSQS
ncbi:hypothetical protein EV361DRAFT_543498 [Lentinula raphanica]|nr:hypothetical protein EV361DRAFT_543498 [Lentinula raphanica]